MKYKNYLIEKSWQCYIIRDKEGYVCTTAKTLKEAKQKINSIIEKGFC